MNKTVLTVEQDEAVETAVVALLNVAVVIDQGRAVCGLCQQQDGHTDRCPVPALEEWVNPT